MRAALSNLATPRANSARVEYENRDDDGQDEFPVGRRLHPRAAGGRPACPAACTPHIRKAVPTGVEVISYQMLAFKVAGGFFLYLGGWKEHYSLYPASDALVAAFKGALTPYRASKGTLRFRVSEPVEAKLIERIAKFQAKDAARRAKAKLALRKKVR